MVQSGYLDNVVAGMEFVYWVSSHRWYRFTIDTVDGSPPSFTYNFELTFVEENISDGEASIPTTDTPVIFMFGYSQDFTNIDLNI